MLKTRSFRSRTFSCLQTQAGNRKMAACSTPSVTLLVKSGMENVKITPHHIMCISQEQIQNMKHDFTPHGFGRRVV